MGWTLKFSVFPLKFSRYLVSLFFFLWISPVALSLLWSVRALYFSSDFTDAELEIIVLDTLQGNVLLYTPIFQCNLKPCFPFCLVHFPLPQSHIEQYRTAALPFIPPSWVLPSWVIEYPFISRKCYAYLCGRKLHLFQSAPATGKDLCKLLSLHLIINS